MIFDNIFFLSIESPGESVCLLLTLSLVITGSHLANFLAKNQARQEEENKS